MKIFVIISCLSVCCIVASAQETPFGKPLSYYIENTSLKIHSFIKNYEDVAPASSYTVKACLYDRDNKIVSEFISRPFNIRPS